MIWAIGHVVGALVVAFAFGLLTLWFAAWDLSRNQRVAQEEMALALGVPFDRLNDDSLLEKVLERQRTRFSTDLLQNRISDLAGVVRTGWTWLGLFVQVGLLLFLCWALIEDGARGAPIAWMIPLAAVFFWVASLVFSLACKLLTGRYPGQAKMARKELSRLVEARSLSAVS